MTERDAFGREKGADPLAELGWSTGTSAQPVSGAASSAPAAPEIQQPSSLTVFPTNMPGGKGGPTGIPGQPRKKRSVLRTTIIVAIVIFIVLAIIGAIADQTEKKATTNTTTSTTTAPTPASAPTGRTDRSAFPGGPKPSGFARNSLFLPTNFRRALAKLSEEGSRVLTMRIAADRIDVNFKTADNHLKIVQLDYTGKVMRLGASAGAAGTGDTFALKRIAPATPYRLTRNATRRDGKPPSAMDYLVVFDFHITPGLNWSAFVRDGGQYTADPTGHITAKIN